MGARQKVLPENLFAFPVGTPVGLKLIVPPPLFPDLILGFGKFLLEPF